MHPLFAALPEMQNFETALLLLVTAGLFVLAKIVSDLRAEVRSLRVAPAAASKPVEPPNPSNATAPDPVAPGEIPADVFSAIVAAVYCTLGENHRVVSVTPVESLMWSREGRRSIFRSHTFR
jgi:hypothetical protein